MKTEFTHLVSQDTSAGFTDGSALEPVMNSSIEKYIKTTKCFANVDEILAEVKKMKLSELRDLTAEFNTVNSQKLFMKNWTKGKIVNVIGEIVMEYRDFFIKSLMSNPGSR